MTRRAPGCDCDADVYFADGLTAYGAGWTVVAFRDAEAAVMGAVCRACGRLRLTLQDRDDTARFEALEDAGPCGRCGEHARLTAVGVEGGGALRVEAPLVFHACPTCLALELVSSEDGRVSAFHAGWASVGPELEVRVSGGHLQVQGPEALGPTEVPGLAVVADWLSPADQDALLANVDALPWRDDLKRRVQHYGWRYDYRRRSVDESDRLGPLPDWGARLAERLVDDGFFEKLPNQLIVNEYLPGQGISAHVDAAAFGSRVASVSLGSATEMEFRYADHRVRRTLVPGSLVGLRGPARFEWTHAIPARKSDPGPSGRVGRGRRVSLTFRTVGI